MAQTNYPEELLFLLEEYLTDGIISAKERQVLLKKAQSLGVDVDEFDLYIDAQQQKADQQVEVAVSKKRGKTCPFCGSPVPQLADKCPACEHLITVEASEELQEIINALENALVNLKTGTNYFENSALIERNVRKAELYYGNNPKIKSLLEKIKIEKKASKKKGFLLSIKNRIDKSEDSGMIYTGIILAALLFLVILPILVIYDCSSGH